MPTPRATVEKLELFPRLPEGDGERFVGYGVMSLPFRSGHLLALRRWPATSLGRAYTSVWHRTPEGAWTFYGDAPPRTSCPRYFGSAVSETVTADIGITWSSARDFTVTVRGKRPLAWHVSLAATPATRLMNAGAGVLPPSLWQREAVLRGLGRVAGSTLKAGRVGLVGSAPNGQRFLSNPKLVWEVSRSSARLGGDDLGYVGPLAEQARLGDLWLPQRGLFAVGCAFFEAYDPTRHTLAVCQEG